MSLMSPAASGGTFTSIGISADIVETRDESYLKSVTRLAAEKNNTAFKPSSSDLLIEQAEERFMPAANSIGSRTPITPGRNSTRQSI